MSDDNRDELEALGLNYIGSGSRPHVTDSVTNAYSDAPDDPDTIRTRLEAIRDRHLGEMTPIYRDQQTGAIEPERWCSPCEDFWPCPDYVDAVAALDLLNACSRYRSTLDVEYDMRLVPDPERDAVTNTPPSGL